MYYRIVKQKEKDEYNNVFYVVWISQTKKADVILYFSAREKPIVDENILIIREAEKLLKGESLYLSLHYGDIVEFEEEE